MSTKSVKFRIIIPLYRFTIICSKFFFYFLKNFFKNRMYAFQIIYNSSIFYFCKFIQCRFIIFCTTSNFYSCYIRIQFIYTICSQNIIRQSSYKFISISNICKMRKISRYVCISICYSIIQTFSKQTLKSFILLFCNYRIFVCTSIYIIIHGINILCILFSYTEHHTYVETERFNPRFGLLVKRICIV